MIGLTGALGAGKSTAASEFERLGCLVVDVDRLGHAVLETAPVRAALAAALGAGVLGPGGRLDRAAVARRVFASPEERRRVEAVVHPAVGERVREAVAAGTGGSFRAVVIDCALLFEGGLDRLCDVVLCIDAAADVRRARVQASRGWTADEIAGRESAQLPAEEKADRADRVVTNDGEPAALRRAVGEFLEEWAPATPPSERRVSR